MSNHGLRHPDVLPKLKELERMVLELHVKMPTTNSRAAYLPRRLRHHPRMVAETSG